MLFISQSRVMWTGDKFFDYLVSAGLRGMAAEHQLANAEVTAKMADGFSHIPARYWRHRAIQARVFRPAGTFCEG
jgi:hypothetical protein